jgi:hypothetical protein
MAHTPEQRDKAGICGAKKKDGSTCRNFAGGGTEHKGYGKCKFHGGNTPNHIKNAIIAEAEAEMVKLGYPIEVHPLQALLQMLYISYGHVAWLSEEVGKMDDLSSRESLLLLSIYNSERDRTAKVAKACLDSGVAERQIQLAEQYGNLLANMLQAVFDDPELRMTAKQRAALPAVLPKHLRVIEGGATILPRTSLARPTGSA